MNTRTHASFFVTGANGGLGFETCRHLIRDGADRLLLACRSEAKARATKARLLEEFGPNMATELELGWGFDMNDPNEIARAVKRLNTKGEFDVLFLQSGGVTYGQRWQTVEHQGHRVERTIFQNVIGGHVTMARLLEAGLLKANARVVIAGGEGARGIPGLIESPHFANAKELRDYVHVADPERSYHEMNAMGVSKFAGALWAQAAAEHYQGTLEVLWFTPGLTAGTGGLQGVGAVKQWLFERIGFPLMVALGKAQTAAAGGRKFADCLQGKVGRHGDLIGAPYGQALGPLQDQKPMNPALVDRALITEFWRIIADVCGPAPELRNVADRPMKLSQEQAGRVDTASEPDACPPSMN